MHMQMSAAPWASLEGYQAGIAIRVVFRPHTCDKSTYNNLHLDLGVVNSGVSLDLVAAISWVSKFLLIKTVNLVVPSI